MISEALVIIDGLLQRAAKTTVQVNRIALAEPVDINVTGDFVMTNSVHNLIKSTPGGGFVNVDNITGAEPGELLFLFGDRIRLRKNGNIGIPSSFKITSGRTILLYWSGVVWIPISYF